VHSTIFVHLAMNIPEFHTQYIFIADDDEDDRLFFQEVISEMPYVVHLSMAKDGDEAIKSLTQLSQLPDLLILDLNMPLKNGLECLQEIKQTPKLKTLPVIILSTSSYPSMINQVYDAGAHLYIRKPNDFLTFRKLMQHVLSINWKKELSRPPRAEFVLTL
jgi:CheY-like chemotaxis protein